MATLRIEAGTLTTGSASSFQQINFASEFNSVPVVMTTLTSFNDTNAVTGRVRDIAIDGFRYRMQEQESYTQDHKAETLSYVSWEPSFGEIGGITYRVRRTADAVRHKNYAIQFDEPFVTPPVFIAAMQTADGGDTANVRYSSKDGGSVEVLIDEEASRDSESNHTTEVVGYMAFSR